MVERYILKDNRIKGKGCVGSWDPAAYNLELLGSPGAYQGRWNCSRGAGPGEVFIALLNHECKVIYYRDIFLNEINHLWLILCVNKSQCQTHDLLSLLSVIKS